jgi:molecular chaperone IbpA
MMANLDLSPLFRSSIGFDHMFNLLESAGRVQQVENWPPYDIEKTGEDRYRITMAVAGFSQDELEVTKQADILIVSGRKGGGEEGTHVLYRGIPTRTFQRRFQLADYVEVAGASLVDGLLTIDLVREVPEAMKPKRIPVQTQAAQPDTKEASQIEQKQAA